MKIERVAYPYEIELNEDDSVQITQTIDFQNNNDVVVLHISQLALFISDLKRILAETRLDALIETPSCSNP